MKEVTKNQNHEVVSSTEGSIREEGKINQSDRKQKHISKKKRLHGSLGCHSDARECFSHSGNHCLYCISRTGGCHQYLNNSQKHNEENFQESSDIVDEENKHSGKCEVSLTNGCRKNYRQCGYTPVPHNSISHESDSTHEAVIYPWYGGGFNCQRCGHIVYQAEMKIVSGSPYHNNCFSCHCCRKPLDFLTYNANRQEIYCKQCFVRHFGPQGYGYAGVLLSMM